MKEGPFRNLANYKKMHQGTAEKRDCLEEFNSANTLTQARKVLFGVKKKQKGKNK